MKYFLDFRDRPVHIQQNTIGMRAGHGQPVGFRERDDSLIILLCRTKLFCELFRRQVVTVPGACRIVNLLEQARERFLVAQRQPNCQMQTGFAWETAEPAANSGAGWHSARAQEGPPGPARAQVV